MLQEISMVTYGEYDRFSIQNIYIRLFYNDGSEKSISFYVVPEVSATLDFADSFVHAYLF